MWQAWRALQNPVHYAWMVGILVTAACALRAFNRYRGNSAAIYFEEVPDVTIQTLGLQQD